MAPGAAARVGITSLVVASGTVSFVAAMTGHKNVAIGTAILGGVLGVGVTFAQALADEQEKGTLERAPTIAPEVTTPTTPLTGLMVGRMMGRG